MEAGGKIKNQYLKNGTYFLRTPKDIWTSWSRGQRDHFIEDHKDRINLKYDRYNNVNLPESEYDELPDLLKNQISFHIQSGEYSKGGGVGKRIVSISVTGGVAHVDKCPKDVDCYVVDDDNISQGTPYEYNGAPYEDTRKLLKKMKSDHEKSGRKYAIVAVYGGVAYIHASSHDVSISIKDHDNDMKKGGMMEHGVKASAEKSKLMEEIRILRNALENSLLDDQTKAGIPAKIEAKEARIAEIDKEEARAAEAEREKKLRTQSMKNKGLYIDIDVRLKEKMRNAIHAAGIPYSSKTESGVFRVFLSNQHQLDIVAGLYNERRQKMGLDPVGKDEVSGVIKQRVGKLRFMPAKEKPNLKEKISVEKRRAVKKADMRRGVSGLGESE